MNDFSNHVCVSEKTCAVIISHQMHQWKRPDQKIRRDI